MNTIATISSKNEDSFSVHEGISDSLFDQLVAASRNKEDAQLMAYTADASRFGNSDTTRQWMQETGRRVYTLTPHNNEDMLAGVAWMRPDETPHSLHARDGETHIGGPGTHTIAARLYGVYRGKGLAVPFMREVQQDYLRHVLGKVEMILAHIHQGNIPSQALFTRLGYVEAGTHSGKIIMSHVPSSEE